MIGFIDIDSAPTSTWFNRTILPLPRAFPAVKRLMNEVKTDIDPSIFPLYEEKFNGFELQYDTIRMVVVEAFCCEQSEYYGRPLL
ncbi:unnamed protein product [Fasciola hepatica]|uniref:Uncharacterized protein n=1 Tax=Fasciola hepatica TaxID=6192 RepID=A0ABC9HHQ7_FASHE